MAVFDYSGQWTSTDENGFARGVLDLDKTTTGSKGTGFYFPAEFGPSIATQLKLNTNKSNFEIDVYPQPFDPVAGRILTYYELNQRFGITDFPRKSKLRIERVSKDELTVEAVRDSGENISLRYERSRPPATSHTWGESDVYSWDTFKSHLENIEFRKYIYRGQSQPYSLQTTFHRSNRKDLLRYLAEDLPLLNHAISGRTKHNFDLNVPRDLGAILSLAQHHGFPTPLLDWTLSPYVAAWFAFKDISERKMNDFESEAKVRILCLNREEFKGFSQFSNVALSLPHASILEALPIENERAVPQQGVLMLTNMQDVEAHFFAMGGQGKNELFVAYDIPVSEAAKALKDLAMMGITRSSMMPGIETSCLDLRDSLFGT